MPVLEAMIAATALDISSDQLFLLYYLMEDVDRAGAVVEADPYYGLLVAPLLDALRAQITDTTRKRDRARDEVNSLIASLMFEAD